MEAPPVSNQTKGKSVASSKNANAGLHLPEKSIRILNSIISTRRACSKESSGSSSSFNEDLSADAILKMARTVLLQGSTQNLDVGSILVGEFFYTNSSVLSRLPPQKSDDFLLALLFQAAVLKFSDGQFDLARRLLNLCQSSAPPSGNALHKIVSCFSEVMQERISIELGIRHEFVQTKLPCWQPEMVKSCQILPFRQVTEFTAIQAILDNVGSATTIHLVDLGIRAGTQWPVLIQALAVRNDPPIELLKLSAVGNLEDIETGKMMSGFAESMNIPFEFRLIESNLKDLRESLFELSDGEAVVVYTDIQLSGLLHSPDQLVSVFGAIEKLKPCLMVVLEIEASTDSPVLMDRLNESITVLAAIIQCFEDCFDPDDPCREYVAKYMWNGVRNAITCEGEQRIARHERLDFWRGFMSRFGFVELALSEIAFYQLDLVVKNNPRWGCCTVEANGKGILVGWKGSPIKSLSVWKFQHD